MPPINENEFVENVKIIDKRLRKPLINMLLELNHISHLFIVQCIGQSCEEHFEDEDDLREHLLIDHECEQSIVNNYEVFVLAQLCYINFVWWINQKR
jgi:hypothetical protein